MRKLILKTGCCCCEFTGYDLLYCWNCELLVAEWHTWTLNSCFCFPCFAVSDREQRFHGDRDNRSTWCGQVNHHERALWIRRKLAWYYAHLLVWFSCAYIMVADRICGEWALNTLSFVQLLCFIFIMHHSKRLVVVRDLWIACSQAKFGVGSGFN